MTDNEQVVAGLLVANGRALLGHRAPTREHFPGCWDLIGGHVERGETDAVALRRELQEEIGVMVDVGDRAPDFHLIGLGYDLRVWVIRRWEGEPRNLAVEEHDDLRWFGSSEVQRLKLADPQYGQLIADVLAAHSA